MFKSEAFQNYEYLFGSYAGRYEVSRKPKNPTCWVGYTKEFSTIECFNSLLSNDSQDYRSENVAGVKYRGIVVSDRTFEEGIDNIFITDNIFVPSIYCRHYRYYVNVKKTNKDPIVVLDWSHRYDLNKKDRMAAFIFANGTYEYINSNDVVDYLQFVWEKLGYRLVELPMFEEDVIEYDRIRYRT